MKKRIVCVLVIMIWKAFGQYATELHSISKCLNNCALCQSQELDVCVGDFFEMCIPGYGQHSMDGICIADSIFGEQLILVNNTGELATQQWKSKPTTQCFYQRANNANQTIDIIGLFQASAENTLALSVKPYYQNMLVSFNIVRKSWIPYVDFMSIEVKDQDEKILAKYIIQYLERTNVYDSSINTVNCENKTLILEKFQFNIDFKHNNVTKINIVFKGLMLGEQFWGFTDFKVAFGCQNNLFYNGKDCFNCQPNFYLDEDHFVNQAPTCHQCNLNCLSCSKQLCFICAEHMVPNGSNCVAAKGYKLYEKAYHPQDYLCGINMLHSFQQEEIHKQVIKSIEMKLPDQHMDAMLIFDLYLTDTQWNNQSALIIQVDGKQIKRIRESAIHNRLRQKCSDFKAGHFSHQRIVTPYFQHFGDQLNFRIYSADQAITDFGISDVSILVKLDFAPRQKKVLPLPQLDNNATKSIPEPEKIKPQPQPQPQPQSLEIQAQNSTLPARIEDTKQIIQKKQAISVIKQIKNEVVISHNHLQQNDKNGEILISINYPIQIKNYPYIYCHFVNSNMRLPGKMISSTNHLQIVSVKITKSIVQQTVIFYMSAYQKAVSKRNLQSVEPNQTDEIELGRLKIKRFDVLDLTQVSGLGSLKVFFFTISWIFLISTIVLMMIGKGGLVSQLSSLMQVIFLHIYINGQYLPFTFKTPISGLINMENLNYFTHSTQVQIQKWLLGNVVQESPLRFTEFNTDINFSRAIYPIVIINMIFLLWFGLLKILSLLIYSKIKEIQMSKKQDPYLPSNQSFIQRLNVYISGIVDRPLNYWYFVLNYQFLTVIWISLLQFFNLSYPKNADRNQTINAIYCIFSFLATIGWPIGVYLLIRHFYHVLDYGEYIYTYEDIFYFRLYQRSLPSNHHRYYILLSALRLILYAICCSYLGNSPIEALTILIVVHILSIVYLKMARPILDPTYRRLFYIQYGLLIILQVLILIGYGIGEVVEKKVYFSLGYLMVVICLLLIINAITRMAYTIYRIKTQKNEEKGSFKGQMATERIV